jgi:hypothetical protein
LAVALALLVEDSSGGGFGFQGAAQAADECGGQGLQDQAVFFFHEGYLGAFGDVVFAAELGGDDQLAFWW